MSGWAASIACFLVFLVSCYGSADSAVTVRGVSDKELARAIRVVISSFTQSVVDQGNVRLILLSVTMLALMVCVVMLVPLATYSSRTYTTLRRLEAQFMEKEGTDKPMEPMKPMQTYSKTAANSYKSPDIMYKQVAGQKQNQMPREGTYSGSRPPVHDDAF